MRSALVAVAVALLAACTVGRSAEFSLPTFTFVQCPQDVQLQLLVRHSCAYLMVPQDRSQPHGRTLKLFVVKIPPPCATWNGGWPYLCIDWKATAFSQTMAST